jgi:chromosome segregation ATPase
MTISPTIIASSDLPVERSSRIEKLLAHLTEKTATLETSQTPLQASQTKLQASVEVALDQFTSLAAKFENQQAILQGIMKSVAAVNQQLAPASSPRKQSASSSKRQSRQTTHVTMHNQTHQLSNHLPLHATPMICDT